MLNEAKLTCRALDPHYEPELCRLIDAGVWVLKTRGIIVHGWFAYTTAVEQSTGMLIVDHWECTIRDNWVRTAILTYVKAQFPTIDEKMMEAFENILASMMNTTNYTDFGEAGSDGTV